LIELVQRRNQLHGRSQARSARQFQVPAKKRHSLPHIAQTVASLRHGTGRKSPSVVLDYDTDLLVCNCHAKPNFRSLGMPNDVVAGFLNHQKDMMPMLC
jgi:hypothetical protein